MTAEVFNQESRASTEVFIGDLVTRYLELFPNTSPNPERSAILAEVDNLTAADPEVVDRFLDAQAARLGSTEVSLGTYQALSGDQYKQ